MNDHESRDLAGAAHFAAADAEPPEPPDRAEYEEGLFVCVVCAENVPRFGTTCERCRTSMEYERLERESNR